MLKPAAIDHRESHDLSVALGHPGLLGLDDTANEVSGLIVSVQAGQIGHRRPRGQEDFGGQQAILGRCAPNRCRHVLASYELSA